MTMLRDVSDLLSFVTGNTEQGSAHAACSDRQGSGAAAQDTQAADSSVGAHPVAMLEGLVHALEGWLYPGVDSASQQLHHQQQHQQQHGGHRQHSSSGGGSHPSAEDTFSLWDLRAAMFLNNCLPATPRSPDDSQQQHFSDSSPSTDALKGATHPDTPGKRSTPADAHSSSRKQQQQQQQQQQSLSHGRGGVPILQLPHTAAGSPARGRAGSDADSSAGGDAATAEVVRLRRVIKLMSVRMKELQQAVDALTEENQRLRAAGAGPAAGADTSRGMQQQHPAEGSADTGGCVARACGARGARGGREGGEGVGGSDPMLAEAVQQLLRDKSALSEEVAALRRHNGALQELLALCRPGSAPGSGAASPTAAAAADAGQFGGQFAHHLAHVCDEGEGTEEWDGSGPHFCFVTPAASDDGGGSAAGSPGGAVCDGASAAGGCAGDGAEQDTAASRQGHPAAGGGPDDGPAAGDAADGSACTHAQMQAVL